MGSNAKLESTGDESASDQSGVRPVDQRDARSEREQGDPCDADEVSTTPGLGDAEKAPEKPKEGTHGALAAAMRLLERADMDVRRGGFGCAGPKFPHLPLLSLAVAVSGTREGRALLPFVRRTLGALARGGAWDHVGGGTHRYAVDAAWRVPHFEKMLYDNAQLAGVLAAARDVFDAAGDAEAVASAEETMAQTVSYMAAVLRSPSGSFFCAEDADSPSHRSNHSDATAMAGGAEDSTASAASAASSLQHSRATGGAQTSGHDGEEPLLTSDAQSATAATQASDARHEGAEGAYYVWTMAEIRDVLGSGADDFCAAYCVRAEGNVPDALDGRGELRGTNVLRLADGAAPLPAALAALRRRREATRVRPHVDRKVVASWNALAVSGLCGAHYATGRREYLRLALDAMAALDAAHACAAESRLSESGTQTLVRCTLDGARSDAPAVADDYAFLAAASLDLFGATLDRTHLRRAAALQRTLDLRFWDADSGAYRLGAAAPQDAGAPGAVPPAHVPLQDGAEPACSGVAVESALRLHWALGGGGVLPARVRSVLARAEAGLASAVGAALRYGFASGVAVLTLPEDLRGRHASIRATVRAALAGLPPTAGRVLRTARAGEPAQLCYANTCRPIAIVEE